jgi:hypothetical protein
MKIGIAITTINTPYFLEDILLKYINQDDYLKLLIIGDNKTPANIAEYCSGLQNKFGIDIEYSNLEEQRQYLSNYSSLAKIIPENSGVRKMVANLYFVTNDYDSIIMIDDDNFVLNDCIIRGHSVVMNKTSINVIESSNKWFNIYECLEVNRNLPIYPRGYPWQERFTANSSKTSNVSVQVDINQGWVLNDPDIDAVTRLFHPVVVNNVKDEYKGYTALKIGCYTSFNNQNTSLSKDISKVYFTPPSAGRNSDIWTAFVMYKICNHMGTYITFGAPIVKQDRNKHDLFDDLILETENMQQTNVFVDALESIKLKSNSYIDTLGEILSSLESTFSADENTYITNYVKEYNIWHETISQ